MTAENMARHRDNPHIEFWKMLKVGYDHFELTKRPPEVNVCEKKYVFNQQADKPFSPTGACPAMTTPAALEVALGSYNKTYAAAYAKAMDKYEGTVWLEPSEAQRKAIVADKRKGRELAYAPTGNSIDAGKLMSLREIEAEKKRAEEAAQRKIEMAEKARQEEEARKTSELQKLAGSYELSGQPMVIEIEIIDGALKATVPGQPVYTLVPESPLRFRLTGPPGMPAGFYVEFEKARDRAVALTLEQPEPRPTLKFTRKAE